ncbi:MAG: LVIVD repeat-containing protein [Gemmatimonadota bacterium]
MERKTSVRCPFTRHRVTPVNRRTGAGRLADRRERADRASARRCRTLAFAAGLLGSTACASAPATPSASPASAGPAVAAAPSPDPRIGLRAGLFDAEQAAWNLRVLSETPPAKEFVGVTNSDLAFTGRYAIQGNYNGIQVWDIADPRQPSLVVGYVCPASQSDVSVYRNLLFVSGEGLGGRLDCGVQGVPETVSADRLRGIRIFDISDIRNPRYIANVQTCRGSHTHTVLEDPGDRENVYIYVSGSAPPRPAEELPGCSAAPPSEDPNTALFRIEVIRVPLAHPEDAAIVSSPRIFQDLVAPPQHGLAPEDLRALEEARARGAFIAEVRGRSFVLPDRFVAVMLDSVVKARGGSGPPTGADSAALRAHLPEMIARRVGQQGDGPRPGPTQCHDITVYPAIGLAGGACGGYGLLLDISDPIDPKRIDAVSDSNFSYWHSATFNNDGTKVLFTDEWGGGGQPKCRPTDPKEWGADAVFTLEGRQMRFHSYYKLPAPQTTLENCVAHNGSLIPIPGRDVMVQGWYQGGISVFDWTDPSRPLEIAFHDRGPVDPTRMRSGGSWSAYWYNGVIVSSEIARGLDILELVPSALLSQNEIDAAKSVQLDYLNAQGQPRFVWPATFSLARAYVDQLERSGGLPADRISSVRRELAEAEGASGAAHHDGLLTLANQLREEAARSRDGAKVRLLADAVRDLGAASR